VAPHEAGPAGTLGEAQVRTIRRALTALGVAALVAGVLRVRGTGGTPPQRGGWRELTPEDLVDVPGEGT